MMGSYAEASIQHRAFQRKIEPMFRTLANIIAFKVQQMVEFYKIGVPLPYNFNPSRSQSSPWAKSDMWPKWHPFDALLAERRAVLAGERAALENEAKKNLAWLQDVGRG